MGMDWCAWYLTTEESKSLESVELPSLDAEHLVNGIVEGKIEDFCLSGSWYVLHYLLEGNNFLKDPEIPRQTPANWVIFGHRRITTSDGDYFNTPEDVKDIVSFLNKITIRQLEERFSKNFAGKDLEGSDKEIFESDEFKNRYFNRFRDLLGFYSFALNNSLGVYISWD